MNTRRSHILHVAALLLRMPRCRCLGVILRLVKFVEHLLGRTGFGGGAGIVAAHLKEAFLIRGFIGHRIKNRADADSGFLAADSVGGTVRISAPALIGSLDWEYSLPIGISLVGFTNELFHPILLADRSLSCSALGFVHIERIQNLVDERAALVPEVFGHC